MSCFRALSRNLRPQPTQVHAPRTVLRIDAGASASHAILREVGDHLESILLSHASENCVIRRDLRAEPLPLIDELTRAWYHTPTDGTTTPLEKITRRLDTLISELRAAQVVLITVSMESLSIPSALKAWIDHVVRIEHTFTYDGTGFRALRTGKKAHVVCAYGVAGYADGQPFNSVHVLEPFLRLALKFAGISDVTFFAVDATAAESAKVAASVIAAKRAIEATLAAT